MTAGYAATLAAGIGNVEGAVRHHLDADRVWPGPWHLPGSPRLDDWEPSPEVAGRYAADIVRLYLACRADQADGWEWWTPQVAVLGEKLAADHAIRAQAGRDLARATTLTEMGPVRDLATDLARWLMAPIADGTVMAAATAIWRAVTPLLTRDRDAGRDLMCAAWHASHGPAVAGRLDTAALEGVATPDTAQRTVRDQQRFAGRWMVAARRWPAPRIATMLGVSQPSVLRWRQDLRIPPVGKV